MVNAPSSRLSDRAHAVLYAVVTEFIQTGEPVGSRTLSTHYGLELSAASIRNVLKDLEEEGFLMQPHTSAGRVPTRRAFRLFIDALMRVRQLAEPAAMQIRELFAQNLEPGDLVRESGKLLSQLSGVPAVILRTRGESRSVQKIRFIAVRPQELLSVVVLDDGSVENRFIHVEGTLDSSQLERVHNLLDEVTEGRSLVQVQERLKEMARRDRDELGALGQLGGHLLGSALSGVSAEKDVIVEGRSTLVQEAQDPERLRRIMLTLEDREQLIGLLDRTLTTPHVQVFFDGDSEDEQKGADLSLIAQSYRTEGTRVAGALGVLGPQRMDYPALVPLVETMATALSRSLGYSDAVSPESPGPGRPAGAEVPEGATDSEGRPASDSHVDRGSVGS